MRERMTTFAFLPLFVLLQASSVDAGDYCTYTYTYLYKSTLTRWCDYGCCGDKYDSYDDICCSNHAGVIAGSVVGVIVLCIVIGVIVCCVQSHNRKRGVIIHPISGPQTVVVQGTTTTAHGYPPLPYGAYPGPPGYPSQVSSTTVITS